MARFVVLRHDYPRGHDDPRGPHFDFMLQISGTLKTWALPKPPDADAEMICEALADHRPAYLDFEGPVSGGRGTVTRWDGGTFQTECHSDALLIVELTGEKLIGRARLHRTRNDPQRWVFSFSSLGSTVSSLAVVPEK